MSEIKELSQEWEIYFSEFGDRLTTVLEIVKPECPQERKIIFISQVGNVLS